MTDNEKYDFIAELVKFIINLPLLVVLGFFYYTQNYSITDHQFLVIAIISFTSHYILDIFLFYAKD